MLEDKFTELDQLFRSVIEGAEEQVPSGLWSSISDHLDALIAPLAGAAGVAGASAVASSTSTSASTAGATGTAASGAGTAATGAGTAVSGAATAASASHIVTAVVVSTLAVGTGVGSYFILNRSEEPVPEPSHVIEVVEPVPEEMSADTIDFVTAIRRVSPPVQPEPPAAEPDPVQPEALEVVEPVRERVPSRTSRPRPEKQPRVPEAKYRTFSFDLHLVPEFAGIRSGADPAAVMAYNPLAVDRQVEILQDEKSRFKMPVSRGIGLRFYLSRRWSVGTGVNYTKQERSFSGSYALVNPDGTRQKSTPARFTNEQVYVGVPLTAYFDIVQAPKWNVYAYGGGMFEKCLHDRYRAEARNGKGIHYLRQDVKGIQASLNLGAGLEYKIFDPVGIYVAPGLRYHLPRNQFNTMQSDQPLRFHAEFGVRLAW